MNSLRSTLTPLPAAPPKNDILEGKKGKRREVMLLWSCSLPLCIVDYLLLLVLIVT